MHDKPIADCTEQEVDSKLKLIYSIIGLRLHHWPEGEEKQDLIDYIRLKYGKKTLSEFVLAFDLAISGELDLTRDEVKVYDQFTIAYLAQIMAAYKSWLYDVWKKRHPKEEPKQVIYTDEQLENIQRADIEAFYQRCRTGKIPHGIPGYFLPLLIKDGFMAEGSDDVSAFFSEQLGKGVEKLYSNN